MSLSERRHHSQRMKAWALKQAKRDIDRHKDHLHFIGGALARHITAESWLKRADHPQSKAKWRRWEYGSMGREKSKITISEVRDDLSTSEDDEHVDVEVYLNRLIAKCRYESLKAQHEETKAVLAKVEEEVQSVLAHLLKDLET